MNDLVEREMPQDREFQCYDAYVFGEVYYWTTVYIAYATTLIHLFILNTGGV